MSSRKRKRHYKDVKYVLFPDDVVNGLKKMDGDTSSLSSLSSVKSWKKCGDGFLDTPQIKNLEPSKRKLSTIGKFAQSTSLALPGVVRCEEDVAHIAWSTSGSEQSDNEAQDQHCSRFVAQQQPCPQRPERPTISDRSYTRSFRMLSSYKDDLPVIDTDSDVDQSAEHVQDNSGQQISDCESESFGEKSDLPLTPTNMAELQIVGYASDDGSIGQTVTSSRLGSDSYTVHTVERNKRLVSDWVRSARVMLQTPQKPINRQLKTPEDSAKKKRKFQSGGLAERLNRLQRRQRSAVSFWRHQSTSENSIVDRPGVMVLEVLEVQEECSMQMARCKHHRPPGECHRQGTGVTVERACMLVLFNRETATHLIPAPRDIIHIYPPWQSLSIVGLSYEIILNTHFSQKVNSASTNMSNPRGLRSTEKCHPFPLSKTFGLLEVSMVTGGNNAKQAASFSCLCSSGFSGILTRHCASLLEAIEGMGQAGSLGQDVEVVVQRVYSIPMPDYSPLSILKPRGPARTSSTNPIAEKGKTRLCVLVQDSYGMFSVVQLHPLPSKDDIYLYCHMWQGRTCMLRGIKVVQRVTRERRSRLFSLIDSLWPPVTPLKDHGNTPSLSSTESRPAGTAPSFCYLLTGQESSVQPVEEETESALYLSPSKRTLRDILQSAVKTCRCSFVATVVYRRIAQNSDVGQDEVWLVLTDHSLQEEQPEKPYRRTVALCVNTSCVLTSSVLEALHSAAACRLSFRDAIKEHDLLVCVEQSVVEMFSEDPAGSIEYPAKLQSLSQHVRLDPLSPEVTPNSLCSLTGVIVGVDDNSAYSWPACNHCGSDSLEMPAGRLENFHCGSCESMVDKPDTRIQMEVYLSSSISKCSLKVKLHQKTIMSILNTAALEGNEFSGYDVESVLGKEVGPLAVFVRVVTRKPTLWIGLEEVCL